MAEVHVLAVESNTSASALLRAEEQPDDFTATRSLKAGDSEDLASVRGERDVRHPGCGQSLDLEDHVRSGLRCGFGVQRDQVTTDDLLYQCAFVEVCEVDRADLVCVAEQRYAIGDFEDFLQAV